MVGTLNQRSEYRIYLQMFMDEHVDNKSHRCMAVNLSPGGLYLNRLIAPMLREKPVVGLEFELPETSEVVWARGEICYDSMDKYFHGTGVRFTGMAQKHERLVRDYVYEQREQQLRKLLATVRRNRWH
jgi:hypothetical protein